MGVIKFTRVRNVKLPHRGHATDAGIDFFVPEFDKKFVEDLKTKNPNIYTATVTNDANVKFDKDNINMNTSALNIKSDTVNYSSKIDVSDFNDSIIKFDEVEGKAYFPLLPHERLNIPSGIHCKMESPGVALIANNKSGIASKLGLVFGASVVDYEYQGEIHINIINTSNKTVRVYEGMKIIQFIETPILTSSIEEVESLKNLYPEESARGAGGFGSTGA